MAAQQKSPSPPKWFPASPIANPNATAGTVPTQMEMLPQTAPIFIEDGKTSSSLVIVNNSAINAGATISIRALSGAEAVHTHIPLKPHEQREIPLTSLLNGVAAPPSIGSVTVNQDPSLKGLTVVSQMLITNQRGALPSYVDEELAMPDIGGSATLRGVADEALGDALIAVSSIVDWTQHVTLRCLAQNSERKPAVITLAPQATALVAGCTGQTVSDLDSHLQNVMGHPQHGIQGYEIVTDGGIGTIAAFGLAPHSRNQDPVLSGISFTDPAMIHAANSVFAGVPFGTQSSLPDGIYAPRISFTNFAGSPAQVSLFIATTPAAPPSGSSTGTAAPEKRLLQKFTVPARRSAEFALEDSGSQAGLQQSIIVETDRNPGEVIGKVVSRSDGNLYEIELLGKDQMDENNGGSHPWSLDGDSISHLLLFNYSAQPRVFGVTISNGATVWDKKYTLAPYETREISINELIDEEVHDDKGQALNPYRTSGVVNWMVPESGEGTGRLMVTSHSRAIARNFSCGQFIVVCGGYVWTNFDMIPISSMMAAYTAEPQFCDEFSPSQCSGGSSVGGGSATYNWNIGGSTVIRPNTSSDQYAQTPNVYGVGPGSGSGYVYMYAGSCQVSGGSSTTNVPPNVIFSPSFQGVPQGGSQSINVSFVDQNGSPVNSSQVTITLTLTTTTGTGAAIFTSGGTIAPGGASTQITSPTTVTIQGTTASSTAGNIKLDATIPAESGTSPVAKPAVALSVVSVSISLQTSGTVTTAYPEKANLPSLSLTPRVDPPNTPVTGPNQWHCTAPYFVTGTVTPGNYPGLVTLRRSKQGEWYQDPGGIDEGPLTGDDTSSLVWNWNEPSSSSREDIRLGRSW